MATMSLARIMYGTSDDVRTPYWMNTAPSSARSAQPGLELSGKNYPTAVRTAPRSMLRKTWAALIRKH